MLDFLHTLIPQGAERFFMTVGGCVGGALSFAFGDVTPFIIWLLIFMAFDFVTGWVSAIATGTWSSKRNYLGICKKIFSLMLIVVAHGVDVIFSEYIGVSIVQPVTICAYAAGEFGSIIENLERGGFGSCVPPVLRKIISEVNQKLDDKANEIIKDK